MTLIGLVTFGNLDFTKLCVRALRETTTRAEIVAVVGKPGDYATAEWLREQGIAHLVHTVNRGFPASLNDLQDCAWGRPDCDHFIICGNDVLPYPGAIDALIDAAETTDLEWIAASQFDAQSLVAMYPEARRWFEGPNLLFSDFAARPWDLHAPAVVACAPHIDTNPNGPALIKDVQNLCLYKRSVFAKLGYFDVNFWPNGYFSDNDYARRAVNAGLKAGALRHAQYFHFWSRTIHQGDTRPHGRYFDRNANWYHTKWGGNFAAETFGVPFAGARHDLAQEEPGTLRIATRAKEASALDYWSKMT